MLDQLKELLEMQKALDEALMKEHGLTEYPLEKTKIALFTELGEMMNELQTEFKWWKKHATYNREKALVEYVDCLHFALSLANHGKYEVIDYDDYRMFDDVSNLSCYEILESILEEYDECKFVRLFRLGNYFGFSWEEIYTTYKKKNEVNYERLRSGY